MLVSLNYLKLRGITVENEQDNIGMLVMTVVVLLLVMVVASVFEDEVGILLSVFSTIMNGGAPV